VCASGCVAAAFGGSFGEGSSGNLISLNAEAFRKKPRIEQPFEFCAKYETLWESGDHNNFRYPISQFESNDATVFPVATSMIAVSPANGCCCS